jgi:CHAT domain-containing protein
LLALLAWAWGRGASDGRAQEPARPAPPPPAPQAEGDRLIAEALQHARAKRFDEAAALLRKAADAHARAGGKERPGYLRALSLLGTVYNLQHDWDRAVPVFREVHDLTRRSQGAQSVPAAEAALDLGLALDMKGDTAAAEPLLREAVERLAGAGPALRFKYLHAAQRLRLLYESQGDFARAAPLAREALRIIEEDSGKDSLEAAHAADVLGLLLVKARQYDRAEPLLRRAAETTLRVAGKKHAEYRDATRNLARLHQRRGDLARAEAELREVLEIEREYRGEESTAYANAALDLGSLLARMPGRGEAESLLTRAATIFSREQGRQNGDTLACLEELASLAQLQHDHEKAAARWAEAYQTARALRGEEALETVLCLTGLGRAEVELRRFDQAESHLGKVVAIRRKTVGERHVEYGMALNYLGYLFFQRGDLARAGELYRQSAEVVRQAVGESHPDYSIVLVNLALTATASGDVLEARELWSKVAAREQAAPDGARRFAGRELDILGMTQIQAEEFARAEETIRSAVEHAKQTSGELHPRHAEALNSLGLYYMTRREPGLARPAYARAVEISARAADPADAVRVRALLGLAWADIELGEYDRAEPILAGVLRLVETNPASTPGLVECLGRLADLYHKTGDAPRAFQYQERAIALLKGTNLQEVYLASRVQLAAMYQSEGRYADAERVLRETLELRGKLPGDQRVHTAGLFQILGQVEANAGRLGPAEADLNRAAEIIRGLMGEQSSRYAYTIESLGLLAFKARDFDSAAGRFERAGAIYSGALGRTSWPATRCLEQLGLTRHTQGKLAEAELALRRAVAGQEERLGTWHPDYARDLGLLAAVKRLQGQTGEAADLLGRALEVYRRLLDNAFGVLSERQQLAMTRANRSALDEFLSLGSAVADERAYAPLLAWKGSVFSRQRQLRLGRRQPELGPKFAELSEVSVRLAGVALRGPTPGPGAEAAWRDEVARLTEQKERLEGDLARSSPALAARRDDAGSEIARLREALPPDVVLVDFLEYVLSEPLKDVPGSSRSSRRLAAFVVRRGRPVRRVDLGPVGPIEDALRRWAPDRTALDAGAAGALKGRVWTPLEADLAGARVVLLSPDGVTARIPFAALPGTAVDSYLIEDRAVATVAVARELPGLLAPAGAGAGTGIKTGTTIEPPRLLVVGAVDYDARPVRPPASDRPAAPGGTGTGPSRTAPDRGRPHGFGPLPGTAAEAQEIVRLWSASRPKAAVSDLRGSEPDEAAVRRLAPGADVLHLATHGYFAPEPAGPAPAASASAPASASASRGLDPLDPLDDGFTGYHPGLLSGLALAGANQQQQPGPSGPAAEPGDGDDGILTALEVAELDLTAARLVVLSACETGLGPSAGGEGLLSLQRAFQVAGAQTTLASLWRVDDAATQALMIEFYGQYWREGRGRLDALRQAQLAMLRHYDPGTRRLGRSTRGLQPLDPNRPSPSQGTRLPPKYWAAFVLGGDWR